jgi:hypothetical protein
MSDNVDINYFTLIQWKAAIKMEMVGLRHSSGRSVYAHVKRVLKIVKETRPEFLRNSRTSSAAKTELGIKNG